MLPGRLSVSARHAVAVLCVVVAFALRASLDPLWGLKLPYITFFPAVALAAWLGGPGPGLLATVLSAGLVAVRWLPPVGTPAIAEWSDAVGLAIFLAVSGFIGWLTAGWRHRRRQVSELTTRLGAIVESSDDAILSVDLAGTITSWNPAAARLFGHAAAEAVGRPLALIVPPERHAETPEELARIRAGGVVDHHETVRVARDGRRIDVSLSMSPVRDAGGAVVGASKIARDITARTRQQARQALLGRASEALASSLDYETTLRQVTRLAVPEIADGCAVDLLGADGAPERVALTHRNPEAEALAWTLPQRFHRPPDHPLLRVLRTGEPVLVEEMSEALRAALSPDAEYATKVLGPEWVQSLIIVPLRLRDVLLGTLTLGVGGGRRYDREDLRFAEELARRAATAILNARLYREAQDANRAKDEFLAVLSHELRTPLSAVLGWARMLRDGHLDPPTARKAVEVIARNAEAQTRLIEDLLDVSRIVTGKMRLEVRALALRPVVEAALESMRPAAEAKGIALERALEAEPGPVSGDAERLQQVVWNLLANAIKFTPARGRVRVGLQRADDSAEIVVSDSGPGIPAALLPAIFDPFRQGDSTSTRAHGGLGIGLALVKYLVELHGGTVEAASGEGQGATFRVRLPLLGAEAPPPLAGPPRTREGAAPVAARDARLAGLRVAVVDDDADARDLLVHVLGAEGAQVMAATSAGEALALLRGPSPPDVLVADIEMPGEDGYALVRRLRADASTPAAAIPALALTAYGRPLDRDRALAAGFDAHLAKPFDTPTLITLLATLTHPPR